MIKNIILDFGGVLIPIDESRIWDAFKKLWIKGHLQDQKSIFEEYETGKVSTNQFLKNLQPFFFRQIFPADLQKAWNALLDPLPQELIPFLNRLKKDYRVFLLSNTNESHINAIKETAGPFLYSQFVKQFEQVYYSHEVGMRKPNAEIFEMVLAKNDLKAEETFYVDDGAQHIAGAESLGIQTWHFDPENDDITKIRARLKKMELTV